MVGARPPRTRKTCAMNDFAGRRILVIEDSPVVAPFTVELLKELGFEVVHHSPCGLPSNQKLITPEALSAWIRTTVADHRPDAVLVAGNGIRAVGVINALEEELGFSVLTANQVLFWHALHLAGAEEAARGITGYGRLFGTRPPGVAE